MRWRRKAVKEIAGDIVGDDSYFPRERYPNGWEIDDMVWEYGAAISAIVVDDNTVQLDVDAGRKPGDRVEAVVDAVDAGFYGGQPGDDFGGGSESRI